MNKRTIYLAIAVVVALLLFFVTRAPSPQEQAAQTADPSATPTNGMVGQTVMDAARQAQQGTAPVATTDGTATAPAVAAPAPAPATAATPESAAPAPAAPATAIPAGETPAAAPAETITNPPSDAQ